MGTDISGDPAMMTSQIWFTTKEAASHLNVSIVSFKSVMKRNNSQPYKTSKNGDYRWHRVQLDAYRIFNTSKPSVKQKFKLKVLQWIFSDSTAGESLNRAPSIARGRKIQTGKVDGENNA